MATSSGNNHDSDSQYDDIDTAVAGALDRLTAVNHGPFTKQARIEKQLDRIVHANRTLGWSYARIADEILSPQGLRVSANSLRVYMQRFLKQREATREATQKQSRRASREQGQATPEAMSQATRKQSEKQRAPATAAASKAPLEVSEPARPAPPQPPSHAAVRRATART